MEWCSFFAAARLQACLGVPVPWGRQLRPHTALWSGHMLAAFGHPQETSRVAMARLGWNRVRREGVRSERTSGEEDWPLTQLPRAEQPESRGCALLVLALVHVVLAVLTHDMLSRTGEGEGQAHGPLGGTLGRSNKPFLTPLSLE